MPRVLSLVNSRWLRCLAAGALLALLYVSIDWRAVVQAVRGLRWSYLAPALVMFVPQTWISAVRWRRMVSPVCRITTGGAARHTLLAAGANLFLPSKLGDLTKAGMLPVARRSEFISGAGLVLKEKLWDVAALLAILLVGWSLALPWWGQVALCVVGAVMARAWFAGRAHTASVAGLTLALWVLHLAQIDLFLKSAGVFVAWHVVAAKIPLAIFAGLLPVTFWGLGTRDAALVWLFAGLAPAPAMAAVGLLTASRYLIPGLVGFALATGTRIPRRVAPPTCSDPPTPQADDDKPRATLTVTGAAPQAGPAEVCPGRRTSRQSRPASRY